MRKSSVVCGHSAKARAHVRLGLCVLGIGAALLPGHSQATTRAETDAAANSNPFGNVTDHDTRPGAHGVLVHASSRSSLGGSIFSSVPPFPSVGTQTGTGYSLASAKEGQLSVYASGIGQTSALVQNAISADGSARAQWSDLLTIHAAGLTGQSGTITASVVFSGIFGSGVDNRNPLDDSAGDGFVRVLGTGLPTVNNPLLDPPLGAVCGGWAYCGRSVNNFQTVYSGSSFPGPTATVSIPITFGSGVTVGYTLDVFARGQASTFNSGGGTSGSALVDYGSGLTWGGISSVRDANGNLVLDYTTSSASGFDYGSSGVPEPSAPLLFLPGVLGVVAFGRRRARG